MIARRAAWGKDAVQRKEMTFYGICSRPVNQTLGILATILKATFCFRPRSFQHANIRRQAQSTWSTRIVVSFKLLLSTYLGSQTIIPRDVALQSPHIFLYTPNKHIDHSLALYRHHCDILKKKVLKMENGIPSYQNFVNEQILRNPSQSTAMNFTDRSSLLTYEGN